MLKVNAMDCNAATQVWFADDAAAGGSLKALQQFWNLLVRNGPAYGYFPKPSKSFLVIKPGRHADAKHIFSGTGVQFTDDGPDLKHKAGQRHLGAAVGSAEFVAAYLDEKAASWADQVARLAGVRPMLLSSLDCGIAELLYNAPCQQPRTICSH